MRRLTGVYGKTAPALFLTLYVRLIVEPTGAKETWKINPLPNQSFATHPSAIFWLLSASLVFVASRTGVWSEM